MRRYLICKICSRSIAICGRLEHANHKHPGLELNDVFDLGNIVYLERCSHCFQYLSPLLIVEHKKKEADTYRQWEIEKRRKEAEDWERLQEKIAKDVEQAGIRLAKIRESERVIYLEEDRILKDTFEKELHYPDSPPLRHWMTVNYEDALARNVANYDSGLNLELTRILDKAEVPASELPYITVQSIFTINQHRGSHTHNRDCECKFCKSRSRYERSII